MNLLQLAERHPLPAAAGVPEWMLGHFRRRTISFADGRSDELTQVHWLQSRTFTIDLRLPAEAPLAVRALAEYDAGELQLLANHEGWMADSLWQDDSLSWAGGVSLQLHNRWPEPALLQRIGNCMIEFAPSGAYVEDWRLQACNGPLIGLRLIDERDVQTGQVRHCGGGLILCGQQLGWVQGRPRPLAPGSMQLSERAQQALGDAEALDTLFGCETSLAEIDAGGEYRVTLSTLPARIGQVISLEGFELQDNGQVKQFLQGADGQALVRTFSIDTLEPEWQARLPTPFTAKAKAWFDREQGTLGRYLTLLS